MMNRWILLILFSTYISCRYVCAELYTSTAKLEKSVEQLKHAVSLLDKYIEEEEQQLQIIRRSVQRLKDVQESIYDNGNQIGDVGRLFRISSTINSEWSSIVKGLDKVESDILRVGINSARGSLPTLNDTRGLVVGINRLQTTLNISAEQFAAGEIAGKKLTPLTIHDCIAIGQELFRRTYFRLARDWFKLSVSKCDGNNDCDTTVQDLNSGTMYKVTREALHRAAEDAARMERQTLKEVHKQRPLLQERLTSGKETQMSQQLIEEMIEMIDKNEMAFTGGEIGRNLECTKIKESLCKEESSYTKASKSLPVSLAKCHSVYRIPGFVRLNVEPISMDPVLLILHHVLNDAEVEKLKQITTYKLKRSSVLSGNGDLNVSEKRCSQSFSLSNFMSDVRKMHSRMEAILDRQITLDTEEYKVTNYGPGGSFENHVDYMQTNESIQLRSTTGTNRLTTFLFYLSDMEGGATVFPRAGLKVVPEKGSVAAFFNLLNDGNPDYKTLHAGCPVVAGEKWIMSRYLYAECHNIKNVKDTLLNPLST